VAVRRPELVGGLALIGPTVDAAAPRLAPQTARLLLGAGRERPRLVLQTAVHYARVGPRRLFATARIVLADPVARKLPHVHAPAVVIRGEHDLLAPARWCEYLARTLPDAELVTIPGAAHAVHWSHPAETAAALERLPAPRPRGTARSRR
jgi:pimeloyl-ACP methyl ester carboxylesterase